MLGRIFRGFRLVHTNAKYAAPRRPPSSPPMAVASKYKVFEDVDAPILEDYPTTQMSSPVPIEEEDFDEFEGLNLKRGTRGVFDIEELVDVLKRENGKNVFVCAIPSHLSFVEHICIVSGRSARHTLAIAEFIRKLFKRKRGPHDQIPHIEGKKSPDWMALDLGNIALHIFSDTKRKVYDLEQLWSVGREYDSESQKPQDDIIVLLEKHSTLLEDLRPIEDQKPKKKI